MHSTIFVIDWHDPIADVKYGNEFKYIEVKPLANIYIWLEICISCGMNQGKFDLELLKRRRCALVT